MNRCQPLLLIVSLLIAAATTQLRANTLETAIRNCSANQIRQQLDAGTPLPASVDDRPVLQPCVEHLAITEQLLAAGAPVRAHSWPLLSLPIWGGRNVQWLPSLQLLQRHGLDLNVRGPGGDTHVGYLAGAGVTGISLLQELLRAGADLHQANDTSERPLHKAVRTQRFAHAQLLLLHGARPRDANRNGQTALGIALLWLPKPNPALAELLLEHGADPNEMGPSQTVDGKLDEPLLHRLLRAKRYEAIRLLMRHGADPYRRNSRNQNALELAAALGDPLLERAVQVQ